MSNTAYKGVTTYAKIKVNIPPIVDEWMWDKAQKRRAENRKRKRRQTKHKYLLTGRVICHHCQNHMAGTTYPTGHQYYRCQASIKGLRVHHCTDNIRFRADEVDTKVLDEIEAILMDENRLKEGLKAYQQKQAEKHKPLMDELTRVKRLLADRQEKQKRLLDLYLDGGLDKGLFTTRQAELETDITDAQDRKAEIEVALEVVSLTPERIKTITDFAREIRKGLVELRKRPDIQRKLINLLNVTVTLENRDGVKVVHLKCIINPDEVKSTLSKSSEQCRGHQDSTGAIPDYE